MNDMEMRPPGNWGADPRRAPALADGDTLLRDEPGRIIDNIDYRAHYLRLVKMQYGGYSLLVKNGGGEKRLSLRYSDRVPAIIAALGSDDAYILMFNMMGIADDVRARAAADTAATYRTAFVAGRLKKRKVRGTEQYKVWIEPLEAA